MDAITVLDNFIDETTCNFMVKKYDELFVDKQIFPDNRKVIINPKDLDIVNFLKTTLTQLRIVLNKHYYIRECYLSLYLPNSSMLPHIDYYEDEYKDSLGVLIYFNDNFDGGELIFSNYDYAYKPKKGSIIIFPCNNLQYKHGVKKVKNGKRYAMPLEITLKEHLAFYDI